MLFRILATKAKTIAPIIAGTQPSRVKPGTTEATINKTIAFITNANSPKVTMVNGALIKLKIGFIKVLTTPNTMAAKTAVVKVSTLNPGTM